MEITTQERKRASNMYLHNGCNVTGMTKGSTKCLAVTQQETGASPKVSWKSWMGHSSWDVECSRFSECVHIYSLNFSLVTMWDNDWETGMETEEHSLENVLYKTNLRTCLISLSKSSFAEICVWTPLQLRMAQVIIYKYDQWDINWNLLRIFL